MAKMLTCAQQRKMILIFRGSFTMSVSPLSPKLSITSWPRMLSTELCGQSGSRSAAKYWLIWRLTVITHWIFPARATRAIFLRKERQEENRLFAWEMLDTTLLGSQLAGELMQFWYVHCNLTVLCTQFFATYTQDAANGQVVSFWIVHKDQVI